ncbi:L-histidine N(alpha)-methyltransferase [Spongiivirga citrea]|uniref:L-histidine N(Alpha)-methyltransferase n=1 Tax=Spongiivirga citrea TaxID=1481457 RepID=A0A6M0CSG0_9FLAO|nr:L-histidine N(alpha)-methyltransferase [Spongiivirga citrea]NER18849.1 L-histidine N(alpha)-methyltransferase [Spongiivirga citrea]
MNTDNTVTFTTQFEEDVYNGLTDFPKHLSSKYFYDKAGDQLFQDIMAMPEYYLTNSEHEVLSSHTKAILGAFDLKKEGFDLIELGAGDGLKTKILLKHAIAGNHDVHYKPVDISQNALDGLKKSLQEEIPSLIVEAERGTYFDILKQLKSMSSRKKVIMVLGSNIGNLLHPQAIDFLKNIQEAMNPNDLLFMGFDLKKNPQTILDAYNDLNGITAAFNKNVLVRINRELDADFNPDKFKHWEVYDPETGTAKSYLLSAEKQEVTIKNLNLKVSFDAWESIHTEISQKYDHNIIKWLADESELQVIDQFSDSKNYYTNYLFKIK